MTTATPTETGYTPGTPPYRRVSLALFLAGLATFATIHGTQPLLPLLAQTFHVSPATSALSLSATTFALGITLIFLGPISDAIGRTRLMHASLTLSALLTLVAATIPHWGMLVAIRALIGVAVAGLPAVAVAYLREEIHPASVARATGLYIGGTGLGGMAGRLLSGFVADFFGWRWALASIGILGLACAAATLALLPPSRGFTPATLRPRELTRRTREVITDPVLLGIDVIGFVSMGTLAATFNALGFRLTAAPYNLPIGLVSLLFVVYALGSVASAQAGKLAGRYGAPRVAAAAFAVAIAGELITLARPVALILIGLATMTVGFFASHGVASGWVSAHAVEHGQGTGQAASFYLFSYYLGASVMGAVGNACWSAYHWPGVVALTTALLVVGLVISLVCRGPRHPVDAASAST